MRWADLRWHRQLGLSHGHRRLHLGRGLEVFAHRWLEDCGIRFNALGVDRHVKRAGNGTDERQWPLVLQHLPEEVSNFPLLEGLQVFESVVNGKPLLEDGQAIVLPAQLLQAAGGEAQALSGLLRGEQPGGHTSLVVSVIPA